MSNESPDLMTAPEVASLARVSVTTVIRWAEDGLLPTAMRLPGGRRRFTRAAVDTFLAPKPAAASDTGGTAA